MSIVLSVHYVLDVDNNEDCIKVSTDCKEEYLYTKPKGSWTYIKFERFDRMDYANFLRTMVVMNVDIARKIAKLELARTYSWSIRTMRCLNELDKTFIPPYINKNSESQLRLLEYLNNVVAWRMVDECDQVCSLISYANKLRTLVWSQ